MESFSETKYFKHFYCEDIIEILRVKSLTMAIVFGNLIIELALTVQEC